ncbi:UNKNOWN [Stylonychia lemnae]|uniref:Uncharacterized protein n=1 Tax=Stylonychia lemnae TaxID=5949 RepID=A0A078A079_STYLE|nr:UNKNOWN [Stylonychia lemnae]|eukprot:CDW75555.1 UNKNOWN [Stylonychia lemnae]
MKLFCLLYHIAKPQFTVGYFGQKYYTIVEAIDIAMSQMPLITVKCTTLNNTAKNSCNRGLLKIETISKYQNVNEECNHQLYKLTEAILLTLLYQRAYIGNQLAKFANNTKYQTMVEKNERLTQICQQQLCNEQSLAFLKLCKCMNQLKSLQR